MEDIKSIIKKVLDLETRITLLETVLTGKSVSVSAVKKVSVKEYMISKNPKGDVQKALVIGCYLEKNEGMTSFNIEDLTHYFRLAKEPVPENINDKINMNISKGHMTEAKEKKDNKKSWVVTSTGERFVESGFKK